MAWVEVYGGQGSLTFELTTLYYDWEYYRALSALATMDDYACSQVM